MTDNMDTTETLKRTAWTETERVGPLKRFGFPGEGEGLGGGAARDPKIRDIFFMTLAY